MGGGLAALPPPRLPPHLLPEGEGRYGGGGGGFTDEACHPRDVLWPRLAAASRRWAFARTAAALYGGGGGGADGR